MSTVAAAQIAGKMGHPFPEYVDAILQDTWGHLNPKVSEIYAGTVIISKSQYSGNGVQVLYDDLKLADGTYLESSPWMMADIHDMAYEAVKDKPVDWGVWVWTGTFKRLKNGKSRWSGKARPQRLKNRFA